MRLAHLSDLHVLDVQGVKPWRFFNKRVTGVANLLSLRRSAHSQALLEAAVDTLLGLDVDHVVVTGDLTNLSLESEFARARELLEPLVDRGLSVVPGNHDVYTRGSYRKDRFEAFFGDLLWDTPVPSRDGRYPWFKRVGGVHMIGFSSALPRAPLIATGEIGPDQLDRMHRYLATERRPDEFAVALLHHNLHKRGPRKDTMHGLVDRAAVLDACAAADVGLVLHGHTHAAHRFRDRSTWVIGCGSSTWDSEDPEHRGRFNVYAISGQENATPQLKAAEAYVYDASRGDTGAFVSRPLPLEGADQRSEQP